MGMTERRPRVLLAIEPPLLADLLRRELASEAVVVDVTASGDGGPWDVAVVSAGQPHVQAGHVIDLTAEDASEFAALVALVRALVD